MKKVKPIVDEKDYDLILHARISCYNCKYWEEKGIIDEKVEWLLYGTCKHPANKKGEFFPPTLPTGWCHLFEYKEG